MLNLHLHLLAIVLALSGAGLAAAQPVPPPAAPEGPSQRAPLRTTLRDARHEPPAQADARRLSDQERAQLRQQLRDGAQGAKGGRP